MGKFSSTKVIDLGSTAFRQPNAKSHCKFVHGYRLSAKIWLGCDELDENNWVFDFGNFSELKEKFEKHFDHKLVIDKNDPAKTVFRELERYGAVEIVEMNGVGIEKFAEHIFEQTDQFVKFKTNNRVWCERAEVFEHEKNSAIYSKSEIKSCECSEPSTEVPSLEAVKVEETKQEIPPAPIASKVPTPAPLYNPTSSSSSSKSNGPQPAPLNNPVTTGWSNPFAGTSWGA